MNKESTYHKKRYLKKFRYKNNEFLKELQGKLSTAYNFVEEVVNKADRKVIATTQRDLTTQKFIRNELGIIWHCINGIHLHINSLKFDRERHSLVKEPNQTNQGKRDWSQEANDSTEDEDNNTIQPN